MVKEAIKEGSVLDILLPRLGMPNTYYGPRYYALVSDSRGDHLLPSRKTDLYQYPKRTGFSQPQSKRPSLPQALQKWVTAFCSLSQP